jgi:nucleoside-diphosphate-sugar epimerase
VQFEFTDFEQIYPNFIFIVSKRANMKILITGITGRVGANLARNFKRAGFDIKGLIWSGDSQKEKLSGLDIEFVEGDLANMEDVRTAVHGVDIIFHLGAAFQAGGPFSSEQYFDINVKGTFNILESSCESKIPIKHLIITSTDATMAKYPEKGILEPISENSLPLSTTDWYGYSKILCEHLANRYYRHKNLNVSVLRFANVWGAGEVLDFNQFQLKTFVNMFKERKDEIGVKIYEKLKNEFSSGCRLIVARDMDGRSWKKHNVEIRDIIHAYKCIINEKKSFGNTYQIASKEPFTWDVLVPYISKKTGDSYTTVELPMNPTFYEYDLSSAYNDFGYTPTLSVFQMVDDSIKFRNGTFNEIVPTTI